MATNIISILEIIRNLEKNVSILKKENHNFNIDIKFRDKYEWFDKLSCNMTSKLHSLLYLSENYVCINGDIKQFINRIISSWSSFNKKVYEKFSEIRMVSRTVSGVPLSLLLEKIKKERSLTREVLHINEEEYSREHIVKCYTLLNEIEDLLGNLRRCDDKLQYYLAISMLNPFLIKLESEIDKYVSTIQTSPINKFKCSEFDAFAIVTKLLTGELLDNEYMNPYHVLTDNVPRKPVFIIKTKRKTDIPSISDIEIT